MRKLFIRKKKIIIYIFGNILDVVAMIVSDWRLLKQPGMIDKHWANMKHYRH